MSRRLTKHPFRIRFNVLESGANTYTEQDLDVPAAIVKGDKVQAIELMKVITDMAEPDVENTQTNALEGQIVRDSQTGALDYNNDDLVFKEEKLSFQGTGSGDEASYTKTVNEVYDLTDGDGRGEIILEQTIHAGVVGTGNASAKRFQGYLLCHLVELTGAEAAVQMFLDDS